MTRSKEFEDIDHDLEQASGCFSTRTRYIVLFLGSACIASICSNMTAINFTKICTRSVVLENGTVIKGQFDYDEQQDSYIMWSMAVGTLLAAWPFQWLYQRFGARTVFFGAGMISTVATLLMPWAIGTHFYVLLFMRFWQGVSFGADFAAIGLITVHWASLKQHGFFIALLSSFSQTSVMFTMPVAGNLCESRFGWPSVYYVHGALSLVLFCTWYYYYRNNPVKHPSMTKIELEKIQRGKGVHDIHERPPIKKILCNKVIWVVWLSAFGELLMSQFIVMYGPTYLKKVLGFGVEHTGYFVALPRAAHLAFKIISGLLSDKIKFLTERVKMIIFNTIALMVSGLFFCILGFIPVEYAKYAIVILLIIECSTGFICGGFYKQHAHFVLSAIQFIKCLSLFIEPLLILLFCHENTLAEWRIVFLIHGGLLIAGNICFCMFATDEPADFTYSSVELEEKNGKELNPVPPEEQRLKPSEDE